MHHVIFVAVVGMMVMRLSDAAPGHLDRDRRFGGPMGGVGGGGNPFHGPGGMGGMAGFMSGGGGPSMGGPNAQGQGSAIFQPSGLSCIRHDIVCPKWCLVEDANGCRSCPCGPAGGMSAMAGGPSGGPMSMLSSGSTSGESTSGGSTFGGASTVSSTHTGSSSGEAVGGTHSGGVSSGGGAISSSSSSSSYSTFGEGSAAVSNYASYTYEKPVKECAATLLCASTCTSGYQLGEHTGNGCRACSCSTNHEVSTTTIHYITQTIKQPTRECTDTSLCMKSCTNGYTLSSTDTHGCPVCACQGVYTPPIEIAVEPPPIDSVVPPEEVYELTCRPTSCAAGCNVGYKCGRDGCPTCDCIHPSVVGMTTLQVYIERPIQCLRPLSCPGTCQNGYRCDSTGCPSCQCVVVYTQTHHYSVQTCTHTLTCASTCTHGYELIRSGDGSCDKCVCKQPVVYAVQRPQPPKYEVVRCPSTSSCSAKCSHGYDVIRYENACPQCKCKPAPAYYTLTGGNSGCETGCDNTGSHTVYLTGGSSGSGSSGTSYYITGGSLGSTYSSGGASAGSYIVSGNSVMSSGSSADTYMFVGNGGSGTGSSDFINGGGEECPSLPPDCDPLCIKYDTPHCRRCLCETSYTRYG